MLIADGIGKRSIDGDELTSVLFEAWEEAPGAALFRRYLVLGRQFGCVLLETFDAEQFFPNRFFIWICVRTFYSVQ